ncbi:MAG: class I SAM-dependent methyltransferase [Candidatus Aminicenantes bacterium]|nr:class I SAM-dependent methyltransferase [Candidatus Aminicenantes bacterium]
MFNNLINIHDFVRFFEKVKAGRLKPILGKILGKKEKRIKETWKHTGAPPVHWVNIPAVQERLNELISGDAAVGHRSYIKEKYFQNCSDSTALSLGCGGGQNEIAWAETGIFKRIDAFDISESRIAHAVRAAAGKGLDNIVRFTAADVQKLGLEKERYDLVLFEGSLHHFYPVQKILRRANSSLKPGGYLLVYDFVGPTRFQWSARQLAIVNGLLDILPARYKRKWESSVLKKPVHRPGRLTMVLRDPSEAADSADILPALRREFEILETKETGGAVLHLLFSEIAHHFLGEDPLTRELLRLCFAVEDTLMKAKEISSDFILAVGRKKGTALPWKDSKNQGDKKKVVL